MNYMSALSTLMVLCLTLALFGCQADRDCEVKLITLDPGHFHAALVQKVMYDEMCPNVHVYAPAGPDVQDHLALVKGFNTRPENPTNWQEVVHTGPNYLEQMIADKPGNVVVVSGKNARKTEYILQSVQAGLNVLADKPMVIFPGEFPKLVLAFEQARRNHVLIYDIMTERYEITTILQKALAHTPAVFGQLLEGAPDNPAVTKESVHHFFKYVAGNPIKRPAWFFDPEQRGEGLTDVSTHLVDLIQWECFPEQIIDYTSDIEMLAARRWTTPISKEQFQKVTRLEEYPDYLEPYIQDSQLNVYSNGEMVYSINGVHAKVSVAWNFQAPEGAGDTHYSIMRGSRANLVIRQGEEENYKPTLYVEAAQDADIELSLQRTINETLQADYPGLALTRLAPGRWRVEIPDRYRVGHEAHFAQVTQKYLSFLEEGALPDWEVPNMIAKYYTTTKALEMARQPF